MSAKGLGDRVGAIALIGVAVAGVTLLGIRRGPSVEPSPPGEEPIIVKPGEEEPEQPQIIKQFTQSTSQGEANLTVGFTVDPFDPRSEIRWSFGDGSADVLDQKVVNHLYTAPGTFNGFVEVIDSLGNSDRVNFSVLVSAPMRPPPGQADIITNFFQDPAVIFAGQSVSFSLALGVVPRLITWDFGDGTNRVLNQTSLDHVYRNPGMFSGFVEVEAEDGSSEVRNFIVTVTESPTVISLKIDIGPEAGAILEPNEVITFRANVGGGVPPFVNFEWEFGDGTRTSGLQSIVEHAYAAEGIFTVSLTVTDSVGNTERASRIIRIESRELQFGDVSLTIQATSGRFDYKFVIQNLRNDVFIDGRLLVRIFSGPGGTGQLLFSRTDQIFLQPGQIQFSFLILPDNLPVGASLVLDLEYKDNLTQRLLARTFETIVVQPPDVEPPPEPPLEPPPEPPAPGTVVKQEDFRTVNVTFAIPRFQTVRTLPVQFRLPVGAIGTQFARVFVKFRINFETSATARIFFNGSLLDEINLSFFSSGQFVQRDIVVTGLVRLNNSLNDLVVEFSTANFSGDASAFFELASVFVEWEETV